MANWDIYLIAKVYTLLKKIEKIKIKNPLEINLVQSSTISTEQSEWRDLCIK